MIFLVCFLLYLQGLEQRPAHSRCSRRKPLGLPHGRCSMNIMLLIRTEASKVRATQPWLPSKSPLAIAEVTDSEESSERENVHQACLRQERGMVRGQDDRFAWDSGVSLKLRTFGVKTGMPKTN